MVGFGGGGDGYEACIENDCWYCFKPIWIASFGCGTVFRRRYCRIAYLFHVILAGILIIRKAYKPWRDWYDGTNRGLKILKEKSYKSKIIKRTTIIGSDSKNKTGSAIGRAIVGDFVAGGVGSIVGASTAKKDGMTKFLVEFADGHKSVETVKDNSLRFQELIKYVQM